MLAHPFLSYQIVCLGCQIRKAESTDLCCIHAGLLAECPLIVLLAPASVRLSWTTCAPSRVFPWRWTWHLNINNVEIQCVPTPTALYKCVWIYWDKISHFSSSGGKYEEVEQVERNGMGCWNILFPTAVAKIQVCPPNKERHSFRGRHLSNPSRIVESYCIFPFIVKAGVALIAAPKGRVACKKPPLDLVNPSADHLHSWWSSFYQTLSQVSLFRTRGPHAPWPY